MMIVYTCPKCGKDLQFSVIATYPPINVTECSNCGWREEKRDDIERIPYKTTTAASEKPNKWIPVSEKLPKAGECVGNVEKYYLVQNEYGDMLVARYTRGRYWEQIYHHKPLADEIVAWMQLPESYKFEREGE